MKILYDHEFFGYFGYSGIGRYYTELIRRFTQNPDPSIHWYLGFHRGGYQEGLTVSLPHEIRTRRRPPSSRFDRLLTKMDAAWFRAFAKKNQPDVWHQSYYADLYPGFKGKRIVTVYDMTYEVFPERFPDSAHFTRQKKRAVEAADGIIAISESTRNDLMRLWNVPAERICTILLASSLKPSLNSKYPMEAPYLLFVGQRAPHKNLSTLLAAWKILEVPLREYHFVCFGGGRLTPEEDARFAALGLSNRVHQISGDDTELVRYYQHAKALIYPSLYEGFGLPVLEAITCGCPVIASRSSSLPEVGGNAILYFDPNSPGELAKAIETILDPQSPVWIELKQKMPGQAAKFSWDQCAKETMAFYHRIAGR